MVPVKPGRARHPRFHLSQPLEKLKQVGLVNVRRRETYLWYSADTDALREVMNFLYEECCTRSRAVPAESVSKFKVRNFYDRTQTFKKQWKQKYGEAAKRAASAGRRVVAVAPN